MQVQDSTLPSAPPEAKKPKSRKKLWVTFLMVLIVSGIVGVAWWWTTQPTFGYVQIRVVEGATSSLSVG